MNGDVSPSRADTSHIAPLALIDSPIVMASQYSTAVPLSKELCCLILPPLLLLLGQLIGRWPPRKGNILMKGGDKRSEERR